VLLLALSSLSVAADEWIYTVRPGDNLWDLTRKYLVSIRFWRPLQRLNRIVDPLHMRPGFKLRVPKPWSRILEVGTRVIAVEGQAQIITAIGQAGRVAKAGDVLKRGDRLSTPAGSSLMLEFSDGTRLLLRGGSDLELNRLEGYGDGEVGQTRLNMPRGRMESQANPKNISGTRFEIRSPSALTAVRGTDFRLAVAEEGKRSRIEVIEGRVQVADEGQTVPVSSGFGIVAGGGVAEPPRRLPATPQGLSISQVVEEVSFPVLTAADPGIASYRLQISASRERERPLYERLFAPGLTPVNVADLDDGRYILKVRAVAEDGLEGKDALYAFELNTRPPAPIQLTPLAESRSVERLPEFTWARPESSAAYHFQLASDQAMTRLVVERRQLKGERLTLDGPLSSGRYFWRVTALDAEGKPGPMGVPREFRILPRAPDSEPPVTDDAGITFQWRPGMSGQRYRFQLASDAEFSGLIEDAVTSEARYRLQNPNPGTYFMRVKAMDTDGVEGPFGRIQSVEVLAPEADLGWVVLIPAALMILLAL